MENKEIINNEVVEQTTENVVEKAGFVDTLRGFGALVMVGAATGLGVTIAYEGMMKVKEILALRKAKKEAAEYEYTVDGEPVEMVPEDK